MQEHTLGSLVPKVSRTPFYFAMTFLVLTISVCVGVFIYNIWSDRKIDDEKLKISELQNQINQLSQDRNIIITKIVSSNTIRPSIDLKWLERGFRDAAFQANVRLKGFSVNNDVISTSLIATEWDGISHPDPVGTIIKMMRDYSSVRAQSFSLEPITAVAGDIKSRTTNIQFRVVSSDPTISK